MADQVAAIIADLVNYTEREVIGLTLEIDALLRETTPVDTGWAKGNWVPSLGEPAPAVEALKGRPSAGQIAAAQAKQMEGQSALLSYTLDKGSTFVTNGVPYIQKLNDGWSKQAPAAFVDAAVVQAVMNRSGAS